jgi:hypothetical protein
VSAYESSPERVKDLAEALELAVLNAKACGSSIIVDQDSLEHIFVVFPSGNIGLYRQCGMYEVEPEPEMQVRIIPKGSAIYGEHGEITGYTQEDSSFYYYETKIEPNASAQEIHQPSIPGQYNYPPCPVCGGKQVRMSPTVMNPICPHRLVTQARKTNAGSEIIERIKASDAEVEAAVKILIDPDLLPSNPANIEAARKLGLRYDAFHQVYIHVDGCPRRDKFGQPL